MVNLIDENVPGGSIGMMRTGPKMNIKAVTTKTVMLFTPVTNSLAGERHVLGIHWRLSIDIIDSVFCLFGIMLRREIEAMNNMSL